VSFRTTQEFVLRFRALINEGGCEQLEVAKLLDSNGPCFRLPKESNVLVLAIVRRLGEPGHGLGELKHRFPLKACDLEYGQMAHSLVLRYVCATYATRAI